MIVGGAAAALVGCGDDGDAEIPDGKVLSTLSDAEVGSVCDYLAQLAGGYGATIACPDEEPRSVSANQQACKEEMAEFFRGCGATFGQLKACMGKMAESKCDSSSAENSAECKAFDEAC